MNEEIHPHLEIAKTLAEVNTLLSKTLKSALTPVESDSHVWRELLKEYLLAAESRAFVNRTLVFILQQPEGKEIGDLLVKIKEAERDNLELRVAQANKSSPVDVTTEFRVTDSDLIADQDPTLRRIALANAKKYGRPLLQKWHPDREGGDADVFQLCRSAIKDGDVELVHILLYRYGDSNQEAPPEFHPDALLGKIRVRRQKIYGSNLHRTFAKFARGQKEEFIQSLTNTLREKLRLFKLMNVPYGTVAPDNGETDESHQE